MRRLLVLIFGALAAVVFAAGPALAVSAHFNFANVTSVTSNSITVSFKEAGLGNSLDSVNISVSGSAECINPGSHHPKAANKTAESASGTFNVSNGQATGSLTVTNTLKCSPPMTLVWTDVVVSDAAFNDSISIPGTFSP